MKEQDIVNNTKDKGFFKSFIPLVTDNGKVQIFEKDLGNGLKKKFLRGVATNTTVDKEDERMTKNFISKMKDSVLGLNVFVEHEHSIDKTVGYIEEVGGNKDEMVVDAALEDESENIIVKSILNKIKHGTKIGYSIGGKIIKAKRIFDKGLKKWVNEIDDGEIYEVSLTAMPAGNGTWVDTITKSMGEMMIQDSVKKQLNNETATNDEIKKHLSKALDEMMQENQIQDEMWNIFYTFKGAMYTVIDSADMTPEAKKTAIIDLSAEFATKIEEFSIKIAELTVAIEEQLGLNNN